MVSTNRAASAFRARGGSVPKYLPEAVRGYTATRQSPSFRSNMDLTRIPGMFFQHKVKPGAKVPGRYAV